MRFLFLFSLFLRFVFEFFVYEILGLERLEVKIGRASCRERV